MGMKTQRQGQIGVNVVERIVLTEWNSRWQPLDSHNDDAVDGLIFLERGGEMTGQVIFVQIKCFKKKASADGDFRLPIDSKKLDRNMQAWRRVVGAAILVFVDPVSLKARWVNVRDPQARTAAQVIVPKNQIFDAGAKRLIALLTGNLHRDLLLRHVETVSEDFPHLRGNQLLKVSSRHFYLTLRDAELKIGGSGPTVTFDRHGWHHISRRDRSELVRYQSFVLLGCIRKILETTPLSEFTPFPSRDHPEDNLIAARASVAFPFRQTGVVKIVLSVDRSDTRYRFHTIYEPRRRRNVLGARKPSSP
ncbi:DUF4365 domain-containing protein [Rhizobium leguminosarum]|uniref:DUF4365 domain-containing protein n=1 Tax=Rhizobium ruizarguesonis TaxID=2081791 RepID=UPI0013C14FC7|nr:DUF4365 domain-containing protein [Rhizobium ruizarguesonis]NEI19040.1 DUF4365 domain-containing protein [Rhizobium ruizarguesonis]